MNWTETTLGEICEAGEGEVQTGPFGSQLHKSDYRSRGTPVVMPSDIVEGDISTVDVARVGDDMVAKLSSHKLREGDIIFGRRGDIGRCALITERSEGWLCGTGCIRVTPGNSGVDSNFLFYYLSLPSTAKWLENHAVGSTMANLNTSILESVPVQLPPLPIQRRIAEVLSTYDDLTENNKRRIELLEEMAQAVYREWFVEMRFPGHEDASMCDTDALGPVPEGWEVKSVDNILEYHIGGSWGKEEPQGEFIKPVHVIRGTDIPGARHLSMEEVPLRFLKQSYYNSREMQTGDIIFEVSGGSKDQPVGRALLVTHQLFDVFEHDVICASFCKLLRVDPDILHSFLFYHFIREIYQDRRINIYQVQSTGIKNLKFSHFREKCFVPIPSKRLQQRFVNFISPLIDQVQSLGERNEILRSTRDLLLPRLMSGEVTVDSMEKEVESTPDIVNA